MIDVKVGDKVYATKKFADYADKGEEFEVVYIGGGVMKLKSEGTDTFKTVFLDDRLYNEYFVKPKFTETKSSEKQKIVDESNVKPKEPSPRKAVLDGSVNNVKLDSNVVNETADKKHDEILTVTEDDVMTLLENSEFTTDTIYGRCTLVTCKLPNGFIITESSACCDKDNYDEDYGTDECMKKITDKVWELEAYRLMANAYDDGWFEDEDDDAECDNCYLKFDCADSPYYEMYR